MNTMAKENILKPVLTQFCNVLIGIIHNTVFEVVCRKNISEKHTICRVFPRPMECANIQPKPVDVENRSTDSMMLSNKNLTPPICKKKKSKPLLKKIFKVFLIRNVFLKELVISVSHHIIEENHYKI